MQWQHISSTAALAAPMEASRTLSVHIHSKEAYCYAFLNLMKVESGAASEEQIAQAVAKYA